MALGLIHFWRSESKGGGDMKEEIRAFLVTHPGSTLEEIQDVVACPPAVMGWAVHMAIITLVEDGQAVQSWCDRRKTVVWSWGGE